jgi:hypothetical protein
MGQLDEITDAQLQSWTGVTESAMEAEMKCVKFLVEEKGLPKDFAGRVGAMTMHILISTQVCRYSGGVSEGGLVEERADFVGIALQGKHR